MRIDRNRKVTAADEPMEEEVLDDVAVEETDLLFEAADVAELLAEVTGESVDVTVQDDGESVDFAIGEDVYTIQAEGDEEVLETSRRALAGKRKVAASRRTRRPGTRNVKASQNTTFRGRRVAGKR